MKEKASIALLCLSLFLVCQMCLAETNMEKHLDDNYFVMLEIISRGYATSIYINGIEQTTATDSVKGSHVQGKLKIGENTIKINVSKLENSPPYKPVIVKVFIIDKTKDYKKGFTVDWGENEEYENVYTFAPNDLFEGTIEEEFVVKNR